MKKQRYYPNNMLWDLQTGETRLLPQYESDGNTTFFPFEFHPYQSYAIIFRKENSNPKSKTDNINQRMAPMSDKVSTRGMAGTSRWKISWAFL